MDRRAGRQAGRFEKGWTPQRDPRLIRNGRRPMRGNSGGIDSYYYVPNEETKRAVQRDMRRYGGPTDTGIKVLPRGSREHSQPPRRETGAAVVGSIRRALRGAFTQQVGSFHVDGDQVTFGGRVVPTRVGLEPASRPSQSGVLPQGEHARVRGLAGAGNRLTRAITGPKWTSSQLPSAQEAAHAPRQPQIGSVPAAWPQRDSRVSPELFRKRTP